MQRRGMQPVAYQERGLIFMQNVEGKVAFITGGASGIGLGIAEAFAGAGMKVVIADMRQEALDEARTYFNEKKLPVHPIRLDVTDREAYAKAADEAEEVFGKIHVLVNNAGVAMSVRIEDCTFKDWDFGLGINIGGVINGIVTILPRILKHGEEGHVVTTSSMAGFSTVAGNAIYNTAKFAVAGLMETIATDLKGTNVGASVFGPGPVTSNLGVSTQAVRPDNLKNLVEKPRVSPATPSGAPPDISAFMSHVEVGQRVLRGILRGDLFIFTHPEFKEGVMARNEALLRAFPDEPPNEYRRSVIKNFGTLLYNPIYEKQTTPGAPDWDLNE